MLAGGQTRREVLGVLRGRMPSGQDHKGRAGSSLTRNREAETNAKFPNVGPGRERPGKERRGEKAKESVSGGVKVKTQLSPNTSESDSL